MTSYAFCVKILIAFFLIFQSLFSSQEYLNEFFGYVEQYALDCDEIDWDQMRSEAEKNEDVYEAIQTVLNCLKDRHSIFLSQERMKQYAENTSEELIANIKSDLIADQIAYLAIPTFASASTEMILRFANEIQEKIAKFDKAGVTKWVVDLRGNRGGNMWAMFLGLGPLIGEGIAGFFVRNAESIPWIYEDGVVSLGDFSVYQLETPYVLQNASPLIGILLDRKTASAAEAIAVAFSRKENIRFFGERTAGLTTGNSPIEMSDGAVLFLATSYFANQKGEIFKDGIAPDENHQNPLKAVVKWLEQEASKIRVVRN